jgi:hypothetical protein
LYLSANPIAMISPEDWINVQKFVQIMQPFEEITRNLSNSQVSISSVIPLIEVLMTTLQQEETKPDTSEQFQNFTRKLRDELNSSTRFGDLMKDDKYTIATYLDPRYKSKFFNNVVTEQVESKILNLIMIRTKDTNANQEDDCRPSTPSSPKRARIQIEPSTSCALQTLESLLNPNEDQLDPTTTDDNSDNLRLVLQSNILEYQKEKRLPLQQDPVKWWQSNGHKYHHIVPLVRQYLSAPPSSVASEQLFSGAGLVYEEHRNRLRGEKAAKLLFVKYNLPLINFEFIVFILPLPHSLLFPLLQKFTFDICFRFCFCYDTSVASLVWSIRCMFASRSTLTNINTCRRFANMRICIRIVWSRLNACDTPAHYFYIRMPVGREMTGHTTSMCGRESHAYVRRGQTKRKEITLSERNYNVQ